VRLPSSAITIDVLTPAHVPAALRLSNEAGWNQREDDWRTAVEMTPGASFCALADDLLVGTCIGIDYGGFTWIAMMLVDPAFQRRGLGARLLLRTIEALPATRPIALDATAVGRLLYEQHGFQDTCLLARWVADRVKLESAREGDTMGVAVVRSIEPADLPAIGSIDRHVFGGDRRRLLEWAMSVGPECCAVATVDGDLAGYVFGRRGRVFTHLGTVIARSQPIAQALVRFVARAAPNPVGIDAFESLSEWSTWLAACGFIRQRPLVRMLRPPVEQRSKGLRVDSRGPRVEGSKGLTAFSIFGPEFA
jgi:ribosomal protein S18 acetylase RimI-like enzyme